MLYPEHRTGAKSQEGKPANTGYNPAAVYGMPVTKLGSVHTVSLTSRQCCKVGSNTGPTLRVKKVTLM